MSGVKLMGRYGLRTDGSNGQGDNCDAESSSDRSHLVRQSSEKSEGEQRFVA